MLKLMNYYIRKKHTVDSDKRKHSFEAGFTLIELLMVIGIFGILLVAMQAMFVAGTRVFHREQNDSELRRQAYFAVEEMVKAIRNTPASNITLSGSPGGVYNQISLISADGVHTRFYLSGDKIFREVEGTTRIVAQQIEDLLFAVKCDVSSGIFEAYNSSTLEITDTEGTFTNHDPALKGMIVRFENVASEVRYIYRKIDDLGATWLKLNAGFSPGFLPTNTNYAIGKTYQIYIKTRSIAGEQKGTEVITGVTPRF